ncbi:MAG: putative sugar phosphate isomerase YwlF [candidate division Hyd24-12 bacterium ADurb.Bin004]|nr:MAG: putative sugar phosphate isomerase YwlF [candidate division Hyd24-12 bacterium ADurb.Bin004]
MRIAAASDHAGAALRADLVAGLREAGHDVLDFGPEPGSSSVDYPDYAGPVADAVLGGRADLGLLICNTGLGMSMAANRRRGIRAALCLFPLMADYARRHNDANVLVLGAGLTGGFLAREILQAFISGGFEGGRHARRIGKLDDPGSAGSE